MIQGRLTPVDEAERQKALDAGHDLDAILTTNDLVSTDNCYFAATGITDGDLLRGTRYYSNRIETQSIVMHGQTGTVRTIDRKSTRLNSSHVAISYAVFCFIKNSKLSSTLVCLI